MAADTADTGLVRESPAAPTDPRPCSRALAFPGRLTSVKKFKKFGKIGIVRPTSGVILDVGERPRGEKMFDMWEIPVPGKFRDDVAYLDLETVKVPCDFTFPSGEKLSRRWSAFLAGVGRNGRISLVERVKGEEDFLTGVREVIGDAETVTYRATNTFDEGIMKGRFTYARRGWAPEPFYPALPGAEALVWNRKRDAPNSEIQSVRERELASRDVSATYYGRDGADRDTDLVLIHLLRDVVELIWAYGEPDELCETWCYCVLTDREFAEAVLFGPEEEEAV